MHEQQLHQARMVPVDRSAIQSNKKEHVANLTDLCVWPDMSQQKKLAGELPMSERFLQQPVRLAYCLFRPVAPPCSRRCLDCYIVEILATARLKP